MGAFDLKDADIKRGSATGDGGTVAYAIGWIPPSEQSMFITINGVMQQDAAYTISSSTLTFAAAPASADAIEWRGIQSSGTVVTPGDGTVGESKLADEAVVTAKIADEAVTADKIANLNVTNAKLADDAVGADELASNSVVSASIVDGAIVNADINASAALDTTKIADGTVTSTEFQYINSLSSNAQTQITARLPLTGGTMSGNLNMADQELLRPILRDYVEPRTNMAAAATITLDMTNGNVFAVTPDQNTTFAFSNPGPANNSTAFTLVWTQDSTDRTITWPASVDWAGGSAPDVTSGSGKRDVYTFFSLDQGTIWYGFAAGADMK